MSKSQICLGIFIAFFYSFFITESSVLAADGDTTWAKSAIVAPNSSTYQDVTTDSSGNSYAVGYITGTSLFDFGNGVTATGKNTSYNIVIVKYDSSGVAQWASTIASDPGRSYFYGVSADSSGNSYAVGYTYGTGAADFGNGVTVTGISANDNAIIVKYNSSGVAQWAKTVTAGPGSSNYNDIKIDSSGNIYVAGSLSVGGE